MPTTLARRKADVFLVLLILAAFLVALWVGSTLLKAKVRGTKHLGE